MRYHFTPTRMAIKKKTKQKTVKKKKNKPWQSCKETGILVYCGDIIKQWNHSENSLMIPQNDRHRINM